MPPGYGSTLAYWLDGDDLDGEGNATLMDGTSYGTPVNKGSAGGAWAGLGAAAPTFRAALSPGKCREAAGLEWTSAVNAGLWLDGTTLVQPTAFAVLAEMTGPSGYLFDSYDGVSSRQAIYWANGILYLYAGAVAATVHAVAIGTASLFIALFDGASSYLDVDGAQSVVDPGAGAQPGFVIGNRFSNSVSTSVRIWQALAWSTPPDAEAVRAWFVRRFGTTPQ